MSYNNMLNIAIIGAGPVGALCANLLAKRGHVVNLYEYRNDIRSTEQLQGRTINLALSFRGQKALHLLNLEDLILKHAIPMHSRMIHSLNGNLKQIPYDNSTHKCIYSVNRKFINEVLLTAAELNPNLKIHFQHKLIHVDFEKSKLRFLNTEKQIEIDVTTDLIIGADGAYSTVRQFMMKKHLFNFSQFYIEHGYLELCIPKTSDNKFAMSPNSLHIWPRDEFMMIALPNQDKSWTVTLFMPFKKFQQLNTDKELLNFFHAHFPDTVNLIGKKKLVEDFFRTKPSSLVSIKCKPYHLSNKALLIGDAAHAIVPFYGQGMNAGLEDCSILNELFSMYSDNVETILEQFSQHRIKDAHAICELAMYNYIEMRSLVNHKSFLFRKTFDNLAYKLFPNLWIPLYNSVTFTDMSYEKCIINRLWQDKDVKNKHNGIKNYHIDKLKTKNFKYFYIYFLGSFKFNMANSTSIYSIINNLF